MDNPYATMTPDAWVLMFGFAGMLLCVLLVLVALRLGPERWPVAWRKAWEQYVPGEMQKVLRFLAATPVTWFLLGIVIGSSFVNPLAIFLRSLMPY